MTSRFKPGDRVHYCAHLFATIFEVDADTALIVTDANNFGSWEGRVWLTGLVSEDEYMARGRRTEASKAAEAKAEEKVNKLGDALRFCAPGFKAEGESYAQHAFMHAGWISTYDGVLMFGHPVEEQFSALPNFGQLQAAIRTAGTDGLSISQIDMGRLSIKAKRFRVAVPCVTDPALVIRPTPDNPAGVVDSRMRDGFEIMRQVAAKNSEHVLTASVLVQDMVMTATDKRLLVQFHHGLNFPKLTVPAAFVEAVLKVPKNLLYFGASDNSLTFWFEDQSFIRTQLYTEEWPDIDNVWPMDWTSPPVPAGLFEALAQIRPFLDTQRYVLCDDGKIRTHDTVDHGAVIEVPGVLRSHYGLDCDRILSLRDRITHLAYSDRGVAHFFGPNLRGVCSQAELAERPAAQDPANFAPPEPEGEDTGEEQLRELVPDPVQHGFTPAR